MLADVLGRPLRLCLAPEGTSRGVALLILDALQAIDGLNAVAPPLSAYVEPDPRRHEAFQRAIARQERLYSSFAENGFFHSA
jgi:sugar (pentulose or hexulose) kinase